MAKHLDIEGLKLALGLRVVGELVEGALTTVAVFVVKGGVPGMGLECDGPCQRD